MIKFRLIKRGTVQKSETIALQSGVAYPDIHLSTPLWRGGKTEIGWKSSPEMHAKGLRKLPVNEIHRTDVVRVVKPICRDECPKICGCHDVHDGERVAGCRNEKAHHVGGLQQTSEHWVRGGRGPLRRAHFARANPQLVDAAQPGAYVIYHGLRSPSVRVYPPNARCNA
jgi:hypothetical protein